MANGGRPRVFVYGTLKRGECNHPVLAEGGAVFLGDATLTGPHSLLDLGWYPCIRRAVGEPDSVVHGEVYEVDEDLLHSLDIIEGHPHYYQRRKRKPDGWSRSVWVYELDGGDGHVVESGRWSSGG